MGLIGALKDGTRLEALALCEFEGNSAEHQSCDEIPRYVVRFPGGLVMNACEEHAQILWDVDDALAQSVDAVDPVVGRVTA